MTLPEERLEARRLWDAPIGAFAASGFSFAAFGLASRFLWYYYDRNVTIYNWNFFGFFKRGKGPKEAWMALAP